jgi:tripartite-type tricarboxylate transporter receptor subunit TctC
MRSILIQILRIVLQTGFQPALINGILRDTEAARQLAAGGAEAAVWTPAQFGAMLAQRLDKWKKVAREANIRAE